MILDTLLFFGTFTVGTASAAVGGAGIIASLIGANKAAKAQEAATEANRRAQEEANRMNYQRWLESQGVGADGAPINTWLPRYAMVRRPVGRAPAAPVAGFRFGAPAPRTPQFFAAGLRANVLPGAYAPPGANASLAYPGSVAPETPPPQPDPFS